MMSSVKFIFNFFVFYLLFSQQITLITQVYKGRERKREFVTFGWVLSSLQCVELTHF